MKNRTKIQIKEWLKTIMIMSGFVTVVLIIFTTLYGFPLLIAMFVDKYNLIPAGFPRIILFVISVVFIFSTVFGSLEYWLNKK